MSQKRKKNQPAPSAKPAVQSDEVAAAEVAEPVAATVATEPAPAAPDVEYEPVAQKGTIPVPLIGLLGLMIFIGDTYLMNYGADIGGKGGSFPNQVYYPPYQNFAQVDAANPKSMGELLLAQGKQAYMVNCAPCHQPNGAGNPAQNIPPLAGSEWVLTPGPGRAIRIVLNSVKGQITVKGQTFDNPGMPPWRAALTDEQIAAILTYTRGNAEWGNNAAAVAPEVVKKVRDATADKTDQYTAPELLQVPETE